MKRMTETEKYDGQHGCFLWTEIREGNEWLRSFMNIWRWFLLAEIHGISKAYLILVLLSYEIFFCLTILSGSSTGSAGDVWGFLRACLTNWARTITWSRQRLVFLIESPDRWLQPEMCPDLVYHQNLELCRSPREAEFQSPLPSNGAN